MVSSRTLLGTTLGTALGLSLAGCAMGPATPSPNLSDSVATTNRAAAASVSGAAPQNYAFSSIQPAAGPNTGTQVASLDPLVAATPPVIQKGTVLWRRSADDTVAAAPTPKMSEELSRLQESLRQVQGQLDTNQKTIAQVAEDQTRQATELRAQTVDAVSSVASLASESLRANAEKWTATSQQLGQLETRLQTAIADTRTQQAKADDRTQAYTDLKVSRAQLETQLASVREAREAATAAEQRAKAFTGEQLASRDQMLASLKTETETKLAMAEQIQNAKLDATRDVQAAQLAAVSTQVAANQQLNNLQLAELHKLNIENRALASSEIANVAAALRQYGDTQLQQANASTRETITSLAQATDQSVADLSTQTNRRLGLMWEAAGQRAEKLAEQKANAVAASLAALQQQTASERITPEQIRTIAEKTVADSTPEFRALALRTMQESQDYIRTTARAAVQDKDPAMQTALADAARDVITKDDRVVFAIRKAVAEELQGVAQGMPADASASISLGPDHARAVAEGDTLDPNRLRIAQLLAPGGGPAPDAAQLANISPAAGQAPQAAGGQQSWSTPGTSLMRARNRADWMDIRHYKVVVHEDDQTLETLLGNVLKRAEPFTGPWQVRWKVSEENRDIMQEKFSLDAETTFEEFVSYLAQYVVNDRGIKLSFSLFDNERIIVISD